MLSPLDIQNHRFRKKMRGYDQEEVRQFLYAIAEETERLIEQNHTMAKELDVLRARIGDLEKRDKILKDTLISAQEIKKEIKENAHKEADLVVREGQLKADNMIEEAKEEVSQVNRKLRDMRRLRSELLADVEMMVTRFSHFVEAERQTAEESDKLQFVSKPKQGVPPAAEGPSQQTHRVGEHPAQKQPPKRRQNPA